MLKSLIKKLAQEQKSLKILKKETKDRQEKENLFLEIIKNKSLITHLLKELELKKDKDNSSHDIKKSSKLFYFQTRNKIRTQAFILEEQKSKLNMLNNFDEFLLIKEIKEINFKNAEFLSLDGFTISFSRTLKLGTQEEMIKEKHKIISQLISSQETIDFEIEVAKLKTLNQAKSIIDQKLEEEIKKLKDSYSLENAEFLKKVEEQGELASSILKKKYQKYTEIKKGI